MYFRVVKLIENRFQNELIISIYFESNLFIIIWNSLSILSQFLSKMVYLLHLLAWA